MKLVELTKGLFHKLHMKWPLAKDPLFTDTARKSDHYTNSSHILCTYMLKSYVTYLSQKWEGFQCKGVGNTLYFTKADGQNFHGKLTRPVTRVLR